MFDSRFKSRRMLDFRKLHGVTPKILLNARGLWLLLSICSVVYLVLCFTCAYCIISFFPLVWAINYLFMYRFHASIMQMTGYNVSILLIIHIQSAACFNHNYVNEKLHTAPIPCSHILEAGVFLPLSTSGNTTTIQKKKQPQNTNSFYRSFATLLIFKYILLKRKLDITI